MIYHFTLTYPKSKTPEAVSDLLRELLIPRKWRHFLRTEKAVHINGSYRNFNELIKPGEVIDLFLDQVESTQMAYPPSGRLPEVVYEDENLLVINKPKGQKTHPNQGENGTALNDCATYLGQSPYIIHRLDMLTGGLLLVAKNPAVVPIMNRQLLSKTLKRDYLATVDLTALDQGLPDSGTIKQPIGQDPTDQRKRMVRPDGLQAITHYQVIERNRQADRPTAKLLISLETGRTHQIRVHLASLGCPIVGDPLYNPCFQAGQELQLVGWRLSFIKPYSFDKVQILLPSGGKN